MYTYQVIADNISMIITDTCKSAARANFIERLVPGVITSDITIRLISNKANDPNISDKDITQHNLKGLCNTITELREANQSYLSSVLSSDTVIREQREDIAKLEKSISELNKRLLSADDLEDCIRLIEDKIMEQKQLADKAAEFIVQSAHNPTAKSFSLAVSEHRKAFSEVEDFTNLKGRIVEITKLYGACENV